MVEYLQVKNIVGKNKHHKHQLKCRKVETWEDAFYKKILLQKYTKKEIKRQFYLPNFDHPFDFAIPKHNLLIEIDGNKWHKTKKARKRDAEIDTFAKKLSWEIIRYNDNDLQEMGIIKAKKRKPQKKEKRIEWNRYWMNIVFDVAKRSTCLRRQIGCVIVKDNVIISTNYNGPPRGMPHCSEIGCLRNHLKIPSGEKLEVCRGLHAEMNGLVSASTKAKNAVIYVNCFPCVLCARLIINSEISRVVVSGSYSNRDGLELLKTAKIPVTILK